MNKFLKISNLTYTYQGEDKPAISNINLEIDEGEFIVLMGPSGCGKSTLALCINGIIPNVLGGEFEGRIELEGLNTQEHEVYELSTKVGIVFQNPDSQLCNLIVKDELSFGPENLLVEKSEILKSIGEYLNFVALSHKENSNIYELSGGEKQRIAIASVLTMYPKMVILDEPTSNLDPIGARGIIKVIKELNKKKNLTVLLIDHEVSSILYLADRLIILDEGTIMYDGNPRYILEKYGDNIFKNIGVRIPKITQLAVRLNKKGFKISPFPLTVKEAVKSILKEKTIEVKEKEKLYTESRVGSVEEKAEFVIEKIIDVKGLNFKYPNGTRAVKDVTFSINKGDMVALMGKNGSGKTTLGSLLIGLNKPDSGKGVVANLDINKSSINELSKKIGYVFQYPEHQFITSSCYDEIAFSLKSEKFKESEKKHRVEKVLELLELTEFTERNPFNLSMGQKRRLSIATMLVKDLEVLILDEPFTGQDGKNISKLMDIIQKINNNNLTILIITHDLYIASKYLNKVMLMDNGELVFYGKTFELYNFLEINKLRYINTPQIFRLSKLLKTEGKLDIPIVDDVDEFMKLFEVT
ncbi:MAG: ATP-binding cassette domain-containing protein [Actinomycetia bacterium]|nr:ATP-binding cassette domain-containing protein [Actinomycetes bacterium]